MVAGPDEPTSGPASWRVSDVHTLDELAELLRELRRRHARRRGGSPLSYRDMAAETGWSHGIIGEYLGGRVLPPTDRFDALIRLLGASPAEQGALATARDRVEEHRRRTLPTGAKVSDVQPPRQLPADVFGFTGRDDQLATLDALVVEGGERQAAVLAVVCGTAGAGKTSLAVHWAHRIADRFPDGQLYVDLRGFDPEQPVPPADALAAFLRSLGVDGTDIPVDVAERAAHYRTLVADRRMLILLDNARDADQVRPLLPGGGACVALVTSRDDLAGLVARHGARRIDLDTLTSAEAVALLRTLVGARVDAEPAAAAELADRCARLPLALRIAGELALARRSTPLAELVGHLEDERRRLDLLDATGDKRTAVRTVFSWSHQQLDPAAARAFGRLGLHPGAELDGYAAAALADTSLDEALALLDELARAHLIAPTGSRTFGMHDLLRAYAVERASDEQHALTRLLDHYRYVAVAAMDTLFPHERDGRPDLPDPGSPIPPVNLPALAQAWLDLQRANLVAIAAFAARHGWPRHAVDLSRTLWRHLEVGGHYEQAMALHTSAERAAREVGHGHAGVLANLGSVHWWLGDFGTARTYFERSVAGHRELSDREGEARALARLGLVHERLGDYPAAVRRLEAALVSYRELGNRHGEGAQLLNLGAVQRRAGRYEESAAHVRRAAAIFAELGDVRLEGYGLGNLGAVLSLLGRHDEGLALLARALEHCRTASDPCGEGSALATIGAIQLRRGRHPEALDHLHRALALSRETGDRSLETETLNTLGETLAAMKQPDTALERHRTALSMAGQAGDRFELARALAGVGAALAAAGRADEATVHRRQAHQIFAELDVPQAAALRGLLPD